MSNFKAWAKDVALRAVKTAAQAAVALVTANTAGLTHVPFGTVADVAGLAALICVLQNLASLKVPDPAPAPMTVTNVYQQPPVTAPDPTVPVVGS